jgi:uncharacterized protein (TIGR02266 family)
MANKNASGPKNTAPKRPSGPKGGSGPKRRHARTRVSLLVQYRFNSLEDFIAEYAVNLSPSGIFITTDDPSPIGTMLYLQFSLKDGSRLIEGTGKVVRSQQAEGDQPAGMGIEFVQFDAESTDLIGKICDGRLKAR